MPDVRPAFRSAARSPGLTAVAVLSLALGIGANAAVFTVINAVMLRDMPVREPGQLVEPRTLYPGDPPMNFFAWPSHFASASTLSDLAGVAPQRLHLGIEGRAAEGIDADYVTGSLFPMLGVRPALGRMIGPDDDRPDGDPAVAVLGWEVWRSRFDGDPGVIGRRIALHGVSVTVIGVAPRGFHGTHVGWGRTTGVWLPAAMARVMPEGAVPPAVMIIARMQPGVRVEDAEAELRVLDRVRIEQMAERDPQWRRAVLVVTPAGAGFAYLSDRFGGQLLALMAIVALVLLLACVNVASLLAARAVSRERELAVCVALGASRGRLVREALSESLLLASVAGALGLLLSYWGASALVASWPIDPRSRLERYDLALAPDVTVVAFTALVVFAASMLAGLAPALGAFRSAITGGVRLPSDRRLGSVRLQPDRHGRLGLARARRRFGQALVVGQVAISVVLLTGAALFARHVSDLRTRNLGFTPAGVVRVSLDASRTGLEPEPLFLALQSLLERVRQLPGVRAAALAAGTPIQGGAASRFVRVEGFDEPEDARGRVPLNWVGPGYFEALGAALVAGRDFAETDASGPRVAIVNDRFARYYFGESSAVGRRFTMERSTETYEIVGVVADMKYALLTEPAPRTLFLNALQEVRGRVHQFVVSGDPAVRSQVRALVSSELPSVPVASIVPLEDQLNASIVVERQMAGLSIVLGSVGALLAGMGLYGLLAFTVARRVPEIGVRMALGASGADIVRIVLSSALGLVMMGLVFGMPLAWWGVRLGASVMPAGEGVAVPMVLAGLGMMVVGALAAWLPSRRAARVAPAEALRRV
jgi:putative ABC transport system permease protein